MLWLRVGVLAAATVSNAAHRPGVAEDPAGLAGACATGDLGVLLQSLEVGTVEDLLASLGKVPSVAEILDREGPRLSAADADRIQEIALALTELRVAGRYEEVVARTRDVEGIYAAALGADHALVAEARFSLEQLERIVALPPSSRAAIAEADGRYPELIDLLGRARFDDATTVAIEQLGVWSRYEGENSEDVAAGLYNLALLQHHTGKIAAQVPLCLRSYEILVTLGASRGGQAQSTLHQLGSALESQGRYDVAETVLCASLERCIAAQGLGLEATPTINGIAKVYLETGEYEQAQSLYERLIEIQEASGATHDADHAKALANLGALLNELGELDAAEELHRRALELMREIVPPDHPDLAGALMNLGEVAWTRGDVARAETLARESLSMKERVWKGDHPTIAVGHASLAKQLEAKGDLSSAERHFRLALEMNRRLYPDGHAVVAVDLSNLGSVLRQRGEPEEAELLLREAAGNCRTLLGERHPDLARYLSNWSAALVDLGRLDEALELARESLALRRGAFDDVSPAVARSCFRVASVLMAEGRVDDAEPLFRTVVRAYRETVSPTHPSVATALGQLGLIAWERGELVEAEQDLREALAILEGRRADVVADERGRALFGGQLAHGRLAAALAQVLQDRGELAGAVTAAEEGLDRALLDLLARSETDLLAAARADDEEGATRLTRALEDEHAARRELQARQIRLRKTSERKDLGERREEQLRDLREDVEKEEDVLRDAEARALAILRHVWPDARPVDAEEIVAGLADSELVCFYVWTPQAVSLLTVRADEGRPTFSSDVLARGEARVADLDDLVRGAITELRGDAPDRERLDALATCLFPKGSGERLQGVQRLVVLPTGPLHGLPFEALPVAGGRGASPDAVTLLESGPDVVYAPSASVYLNRKARAREVQRAAHGPLALLVVGDPSFDRAGASDAITAAAPVPTTPAPAPGAARLFAGELAPLPGSRVEAQRVAELARATGGSVVALLGTRAHVPTVEAALDGVTHLHLATHGRVGSEERPYDAGLALSQPRTPTLEDSGFLSLDDLLRRWRGRLSRCELVTLSACDGQPGTRVGDSRISLPWGFFYAGAPSVVVSLWKVDDAATTLLMGRFYENLFGRFEEPRSMAGRSFAAGVPLPKATALREAKLWLRGRTAAENRQALAELGLAGDSLASNRDEDGPPGPTEASSERASLERFDYAHPRFWAAFVLVGAPE